MHRSVRTTLRANEVVGVEALAALQALHHGAIGKIKTLGLTGDIRPPAIVWLIRREPQRQQIVAATVGACRQSPSILACAAKRFGTVANRSNSTELRALMTAISRRGAQRVGVVVLAVHLQGGARRCQRMTCPPADRHPIDGLARDPHGCTGVG